MDDKTFWTKFKELADREKEKRRKTELGPLAEMEFKEAQRISWISFSKDFSEYPSDEYNKVHAQVSKLMKDHKIEADFDSTAMFGDIDYDVVFLKKLNQIMPIRDMEVVFVMHKPRWKN